MDSDLVSARLEQARKDKREANNKDRRKRKASDLYDALWHYVRDLTRPHVKAIKRLARAIAKRHPDGTNAVQTLVDEYENASAAELPGYDLEHRLSKLSAKRDFCRALLEAAKPSPDESAIIGFVAQALATYKNLDTDDVCKDLHSLRNEEAQAEPASTRGKNARALLCLLAKNHGYESPNESLKYMTAIMGDDAAKELQINKGSVSKAFDQLFGREKRQTGFDRYRATCAAGEPALRRWFIGMSGDGRESGTVSLQATELTV